MARGRYRILLGMAAGVGKTYRMLQEGRQAQSEGRDVVIGYLEPHDRPETSALAEGLEVVPRLRAEHGGLVLAEMDVDAVLRRSPELALIDELAHTNAPGMRNEKRYQDIDEVLDAGIDVISTVNVQHLESLNDAIFELTETRVRETFPDRILDEADEVILVDLAPEALRDRLRAGKVYCAGAGGGGARQLLPRRQALRAPRARSARGRRGRRAAPDGAHARAAQPAGRERTRARTRGAAAEVAADHAARVAFGAATRWRDGRSVGAAPGEAPDRGGSDAARSPPASVRDPRRALPRGGGRRPGRHRPAGGGRARLDLRLRGHTRRVASPRDLRWVAPVADGARAARRRHPRRREPGERSKLEAEP